MMLKKGEIPKIRKSIKNFLTDESGRITKRDTLGIALGGAIFAV